MNNRREFKVLYPTQYARHEVCMYVCMYGIAPFPLSRLSWGSSLTHSSSHEAKREQHCYRYYLQCSQAQARQNRFR